MMQVISTGGPMWNQPLSDMRVKALIAVDTGPLTIPREVIDYILALERHYHDMRQERNRDFLKMSWEQFSPKADGADGGAGA